MIRTHFMKPGSLLFIFLAAVACSGNMQDKKKVTDDIPQAAVKPDLIIGNETELLLKDLEDNGDYVNSQQFPSLIKASIVQESIGKNMLVVDLRSAAQYRAGHIKGAVNKKFEELPLWFETGIKPFEYDRIIMVCDDGQLSSYTTALLRMMGYGNVFAMRWGMSVWNIRYASEGWMKGLTGRYESQLETSINERPDPSSMPGLNTGLATGADISSSRFRKLFEEGTINIQITADKVFADPKSYFVINLERKDKYDDGHIPGAIRYKPDATLGFKEEMASIPSDRIVVIYCGTGHNSAFATAFLRLFGYDARTLKYGNNSFMHDKMIAQRTSLSWLPFTSEEVNEFEVVK